MRICVVGASTRFLSGLTVYTYRLSNALAVQNQVSALLMRQLLPTRLYPGHRRVGNDLAQLAFDPSVAAFDGLDWYWVPSMVRALRFLRRRRPEVMIFEWWTGTVVHSYIALALVARLLGARIVVEFHEVQDPGEMKVPLARQYIRAAGAIFLRLADAFVVHTETDRALLSTEYDLKGRPVEVMPHGPHDHYQAADTGADFRPAPPDAFNLLFFGLIRPYKGLDLLLRAFNGLPREQAETLWLTIVGETWEGWDLPAQLINASPHRDRISFINEYVPDEEVGKYFRSADAIVLPYHRSGISGPLHVAMGYGLPVVATDIGGMRETTAGYGGALLVPPADVDALAAAIQDARQWKGRRFVHPKSWRDTADTYLDFLATIPGATARGVSLKGLAAAARRRVNRIYGKPTSLERGIDT